MGATRYISKEALRLLYAHSGNQCSYPGCCAPIFEDNGLLTAECCHIKAFSVGGSRYDATQTDEERNGVDNLMLLCSRHHKMVDADEATYTVEMLHKYKMEHEARFSAESLKLTEKQLEYLRRCSESFWKRIEEIDRSDNGASDFKIMVDTDRPTQSLLEDIERLLEQINADFAELNEFDNTLSKNIREYLISIGVDTTEYDNRSEKPYVNPFDCPHWEMFAYGVHNRMRELSTLYFQLVIRALERISNAEMKEHPLLNEFREKLAEYQKHNYYID